MEADNYYEIVRPGCNIVTQKTLHGVRESMRKLNLELHEIGVGDEVPLVELVLVTGQVASHVGEWCVVGGVCLGP